MLAPLIAGQTISQISAGVSFPPGQIIGPIAGFAVLAVVAAGLVRAILRRVREPGTAGAPASGRRHLWRTWVMWTTAGEALGFLVPAVVAALTAPYAAAVSVPALLLAGAVEGALLGAAQAHVLRRAVPGFAGYRWVAVTSAAAVVAWLVGLLPSVAGGTVDGWPVPVVVALASVGGLVLLSSIGVAQWTVLRRFVPRAGRWIGFTAAGWLAGLTAFMLVASPLWHEGQPVALTAAIGVLGGIVMAATVAAVTGLGLVRLLRGMPPATRQPRPDRQADPARQADLVRETDRADHAEPADQLI